MNADFLRVMLEMIGLYEETHDGERPGCVLMSPATMMSWNDGEVATVVDDVPIVLNTDLPYGPIFVADASNLGLEHNLP